MYQRKLSFNEAIERALRIDYLNFGGRASVSAFWWFMLFAVMSVFSATFVSGVLGFNVAIAVCAVMLLLLTPAIVSMTVRRLHDANRSGWWLMLVLTGVGVLPLLMWLCMPSHMDVNSYGDIPDLVF